MPLRDDAAKPLLPQGPFQICPQIARILLRLWPQAFAESFQPDLESKIVRLLNQAHVDLGMLA